MSDRGSSSTSSIAREALVGRDALGDVGAQLLAVERAARHHERLRALAVALVGHADDRGVGDGRVGDAARASSSAGRDLEAADLDQLLEAVDEEDVPVLVDVAEVAGVQPAVGVDGRGRGVRVVAVAAPSAAGRAPRARRPRPPAASPRCAGRRPWPRCRRTSRPTDPRRISDGSASGQTATSGAASVMP